MEQATFGIRVKQEIKAHRYYDKLAQRITEKIEKLEL